MTKKLRTPLRNQDKKELFKTYFEMLATPTLKEVCPMKPEYNFDLKLGRKHRFDWAFPLQKVGVEVDGGQFAPHGGYHAEDIDREKTNLAAMLGWRVFHFSPNMLNKDPTECIHQVEYLLRVIVLRGEKK
jgi:very-short-patch-repair endonuclease